MDPRGKERTALQIETPRREATLDSRPQRYSSDLIYLHDLNMGKKTSGIRKRGSLLHPREMSQGGLGASQSRTSSFTNPKRESMIEYVVPQTATDNSAKAL